MQRVLILVLSSALVQCGAVVQPVDGARSDAGTGFDAAFDGSTIEAGPTACLPLRRGCESSADCPPGCSTCEPLVDWPDEAHLGRPRVLDHVCVSPVGGRPAYRGIINCDEPYAVAWTYGDDDELGRCLPREVCLEMQRLQRSLGSTPYTRRCMSADGTAYLGGTIFTAGCHPRVPLYCSTHCRCSEGRICAFLSEQPGAHYGYCVPYWTGNSDLGRPCRGGVNREPCPAGMGCLQPLRHGVGGVADEDRWGVCLPAEECVQATDPESLPPRYYHCDLSSVRDAGR
jgi:hypothetical protein